MEDRACGNSAGVGEMDIERLAIKFGMEILAEINYPDLVKTIGVRHVNWFRTCGEAAIGSCPPDSVVRNDARVSGREV